MKLRAFIRKCMDTIMRFEILNMSLSLTILFVIKIPDPDLALQNKLVFFISRTIAQLNIRAFGWRPLIKCYIVTFNHCLW